MPPPTPVAPMRKRRLRASIAGVEGWPVTACVAAAVRSVDMDAFGLGDAAVLDDRDLLRIAARRRVRQALAKQQNYTANAQRIGRLVARNELKPSADQALAAGGARVPGTRDAHSTPFRRL